MRASQNVDIKNELDTLVAYLWRPGLYSGSGHLLFSVYLLKYVLVRGSENRLYTKLTRLFFQTIFNGTYFIIADFQKQTFFLDFEND